MGEPCLFCLEEETEDPETFVVPFNLAVEPSIPCACRFNAHMNCWMQYYFVKGGFECPICHSKVPGTEMRQHTVTIQTMNHVYHLRSEPIVIQLSRPPRGRQPLTIRQRAIGLFVIAICILFLIFSIFSTIIFRP